MSDAGRKTLHGVCEWGSENLERWEELQGDGVVLDEADIQAVVSAELDVRPYVDRQICITA
jgi:hypothetical protein